MIPRLSMIQDPLPLYREACAVLKAAGFAGDLSMEAGNRIVFATDNSIYQVTPEAVAFPRSMDDLVRVARVAADPQFRDLVLRPRGGGTGTNGQSLGHGMVVDMSRYMNRILEINATEGWVRVEAGVVKDQLNAALAPYGLFFAPELSTSDRATIGGMISTDASGQGSCLYGKTRDHVIGLTSVLVQDGTIWNSCPLTDAELNKLIGQGGVVGDIHRIVDAVHRTNVAQIAEHFPKLNRCLTGYDLAHIRDDEQRFDLNAVLCGSEGTLALIAEAKLRVLPIPRASALVNLRYRDFDGALRDAGALMRAGAASIETIDSKVLALARKDGIWGDVAEFFPEDLPRAEGINIVEFLGNDEAEIEAGIAAFLAVPASDGRLGYTVARGAGVGHIWTMRKRAVGLLGNVEGARRPVPFVEDVAVPPEHLADFVAEFRAVLDRRGLEYGMFGHVDAGVLHVRPALDLKDPDQERLIREVTEEVVAIAQRYGGLLWGEHGKGFRSEFVPTFFGPLTPCLATIKAAFDPFDQLNPGKIASARAAPLATIDGVPRRGQQDRAIPPAVRAGYDEALHCNGNGACYNYDPDNAMCPSWKGTRERRHSPKGRSALLREWLRRLSAEGTNPLSESAAQPGRASVLTVFARLRNSLGARRGEADFSHVVKEAMDGCLACKACAGTCPIQVDVPRFRAKFLELYYGRYARPLKDYAVGLLEFVLPWLALMPRAANLALRNPAVVAGLARVGLVDMPRLSGIRLARELAARGIRMATPDALAALPEDERARSVVLVQDAFTCFFDSQVVIDAAHLLQRLGFLPWLAPYAPNGKPLHVHGFLGPFTRIAAQNAQHLNALAASGIALVGIDPSMTLTYRSEYAQALGSQNAPRVQLLQEWLASRLGDIVDRARAGRFGLLLHCTERTNAASAAKDWQAVFSHLGLGLDILPAGCCGMAGTYGHETAHRAMSERIYDLSWRRHTATFENPGDLLATGFSCRCQVKRLDAIALRHPVQALLAHLMENAA